MSHRDADSAEDENGGFALSAIFTVSREPLLPSTNTTRRLPHRHPPNNSFPRTIPTHVPASVYQEPARPPSPEPTIAVYENIESLNVENPHHHGYQDDNPSPSQWSTISVRLVGSHPLWGHYLYVYMHVNMPCSPPTSTSLPFSCASSHFFL